MEKKKSMLQHPDFKPILQPKQVTQWYLISMHVDLHLTQTHRKNIFNILVMNLRNLEEMSLKIYFLHIICHILF